MCWCVCVYKHNVNVSFCKSCPLDMLIRQSVVNAASQTAEHPGSSLFPTENRAYIIVSWRCQSGCCAWPAFFWPRYSHWTRWTIIALMPTRLKGRRMRKRTPNYPARCKGPCVPSMLARSEHPQKPSPPRPWRESADRVRSMPSWNTACPIM